MLTHATTGRIALATACDYPTVQPDDAPLASELACCGLMPVVCVWNDPAVDWSAFDAVLIRTIWDYFKHHADFLAWLDRLDQLGVPTINDSALLRWNSNKRYLLELAERDVAIIPTRWTSAATLPDVLATMPGQQVVVKPAISGGAWHTLRGRTGDADFTTALRQLPRGLDYLVQPFVPEVVSEGEWSLLYFAGEFSHAVIKRPAIGDYRVQGEHGGSAEPAQPTPAILATATKALDAAAALGYGNHAYVRVDGVVSKGRFLIMELEFIEPFLHLAIHPPAARRLAREVAARHAAANRSRMG